jgi:CheY-like chemotaxis protein/HPt (histidine-containing phosphotransfer) domain-containing protein
MKNEMERRRILVADDDVLSREVLKLLLENAGYAVDTAESGDAAVRHLSASPDSPPSVVLADLQMPGTAGNALARELRRICGSSTLLLAMSGGTPETATSDAFDGFLLKPFTMEDLSVAIAAHGNTKTPDTVVHDNAAVLDQTIYNKLAASMKKERLRQLYDLYLADVEERATRMARSASYGDSRVYRKDAHAIRGGSGMLGAIELQDRAASLEESGIDANHVASLNELRVACSRLRRILILRDADRGAGSSEEDRRDEHSSEK